MLRHLRPAFTLLLLFTLLLGLAYPLAFTGVAQLALADRANGSPVERDGVIVGSRLVGQNFAQDRYFQPRPSATSAPDPADASKTIDAPYNAASSSGSNRGPLSQQLMDRVKGSVGEARNVPADAATTSASGLDPHITPQNALLQAARVAKARGLPEDRVRGLVTGRTEAPLLGVIGEPRVNVLLLNLALDELK